MVRDYRIKEYDWIRGGSPYPVPTSGTNKDYKYITSGASVIPINGEILQVQWKTAGGVGSFFLVVSGTEECIWYNTAPSGTAFAQAYPMVYAVDNTNATGSPQAFTQRVVHDPIFFAGSGAAGGSIIHFSIKYR